MLLQEGVNPLCGTIIFKTMVGDAVFCRCIFFSQNVLKLPCVRTFVFFQGLFFARLSFVFGGHQCQSLFVLRYRPYLPLLALTCPGNSLRKPQILPTGGKNLNNARAALRKTFPTPRPTRAFTRLCPLTTPH